MFLCVSILLHCWVLYPASLSRNCPFSRSVCYGSSVVRKGSVHFAHWKLILVHTFLWFYFLCVCDFAKTKAYMSQLYAFSKFLHEDSWMLLIVTTQHLLGADYFLYLVFMRVPKPQQWYRIFICADKTKTILTNVQTVSWSNWLDWNTDRKNYKSWNTHT